MVKKKGVSAGPRLKLCSQCEEPNPPRQFYCKQCNHPFYSEEYFASRSVSQPVAAVAQIPGDELRESVAVASVDADMLESLLYDPIASGRPAIAGLDSMDSPVVANVHIFPSSEDIKIPSKKSVRINRHHSLAFTGASASVDSVDLLNGVLAVVVDNSRIQFWSFSSDCIGELSFEGTWIKQARWTRQSNSINFLGLLAVVALDRIDLILVPASSPDSSVVVWSTKAIPEPFFPSHVDSRIGANSKSVELVCCNNENNFSHFFNLSGINLNNGDQFAVSVKLLKVFASNDTVKRVADELSSSPSTGTCVAFIRDDRFRFAAGYTNGQISIFDLRNEHGPENTIVSLVGHRRWLVDLVSLGSEILLAAYQAGSVVLNINSDAVIQPIGGEVKSAQCLGIGSIGNMVYTGMTSGVVLSVDRTLRDKIRRGMTRFVAQWETTSHQPATTVVGHMGAGALENQVIQRLTLKSHGLFTVKLFDEKAGPAKSLKLIRASDGGSNEAVPKLDPSSRPLPVTCLIADEERRIVVFGLEGGLIHIVEIN